MGRRVLAVFLSLCLLIATIVGMTTIAGASASGIVSDTGILVILNSDSSLASSYTYALCQQDNTNHLFIFPSFNINVTSTNYTVEWYSSQTNSTEGGTLIGSNAGYTLYSYGGEADNLGNAGTTTYYYYVLTVTDSSTGEELAVETVGPLAFTVEEHTIVLQEVKDATCTEVGNLGDGYCTSCSKLLWEGVRTEPTGHTWDEGTVTKEATCVEKGEITYTCTVCGETSTEEIPTNDNHSWDEGTVIVEATCTEAGVMTYSCSGCGDTYTEEIPAGHDWEFSDYYYATCTEGSYTLYECTRCDETYKEAGSEPATGHTTETHNAQAATCTEDGYTGNEFCTVCQNIVSRGSVIPKTGHTAAEAVVENEVDATCTTDGSYDSVVYCSVCGEEISRETVTVEAVGHSYELGVCSVCGAKDPDYVTEVTLDAALAETLTSGLVTGVTIRTDLGSLTVSEVADDHLLQHIVDVMGFTLNNEAHGNWLLSETESFIIRTTENGRTALKKVTSLFYGDIDFASGATITMELSGSEDLASGAIYVLHYTNGNWQQESSTSSYADGKLTIEFQPDSASPFLIISVSDYTSSRNNILPLLLQIQSLNQTSTSEETTEEVEEEVVEIDEPVEAGETDTE